MDDFKFDDLDLDSLLEEFSAKEPAFEAAPDAPEPEPEPIPEPQPEAAPEPKPEPERPAARPVRNDPKKDAQKRSRKSPPSVLGLFPLCLFVFLVLAFGLLNLLTPDKEISDSENRLLAQKPAFSAASLADGSYFDSLETWYADQFYNRDGWISRNLLGLKLLGRHESSGVFLGDDGYLFAQPEQMDEEKITEKTSAIRAFASAYPDIPMHVAVAPSAAVILTDKLPDNAPVLDQLSMLNSIAARLGESVDFMDMPSILLQHRDEYIYYKTDHHWTSLGAYYAFASMYGALGITDPCSYQVYTVATDFEGTLSSESGSHSSADVVDIYVPTNTDVLFYVNYVSTGEKSRSMYVSAALEEKDKYTVFFGGNYPLVEIATTNNNDRVLLVFKDSYANSFMQFLTPYYEKILMIDPRYYYDDLKLLMSTENVTDVLFLYSANTIMTDSSLTDVLTSAVNS